MPKCNSDMPIKVWLLENREAAEDERGLEGVFSTKESAEQCFRERFSDLCGAMFIHSLRLDSMTPQDDESWLHVEDAYYPGCAATYSIINGKHYDPSGKMISRECAARAWLGLVFASSSLH